MKTKEQIVSLRYSIIWAVAWRFFVILMAAVALEAQEYTKVLTYGVALLVVDFAIAVWQAAKIAALKDEMERGG